MTGITDSDGRNALGPSLLFMESFHLTVPSGSADPWADSRIGLIFSLLSGGDTVVL
jgi:hypothetical protein